MPLTVPGYLYREKEDSLFPDTKQILKRSIPCGEVKDVFYPACGFEFGSISDILETIPTVKNVYLADNETQFKMDEIIRWFVYAMFIFNGLRPAASSSKVWIKEREFDAMAGLKAPLKENDCCWIDVAGGGRKVRLHFYRLDCLRPIRLFRKISDLTIVRCAGYAGMLSEHRAFYENVIQATRDGKYAFVSCSSLPADDLLRRFKLVESNRLLLSKDRLSDDSYALLRLSGKRDAAAHPITSWQMSQAAAQERFAAYPGVVAGFRELAGVDRKSVV